MQLRACLAGLWLLQKQFRLRLRLLRWSGFSGGVGVVLENVWQNSFTCWIEVVKSLNYPFFPSFFLFLFPLLIFFIPFFFPPLFLSSRWPLPRDSLPAPLPPPPLRLLLQAAPPPPPPLADGGPRSRRLLQSRRPAPPRAPAADRLLPPPRTPAAGRP